MALSSNPFDEGDVPVAHFKNANVFGDKVAIEVSWLPLRGDKEEHSIRRLVAVNAHSLLFRLKKTVLGWFLIRLTAVVGVAANVSSPLGLTVLGVVAAVLWWAPPWPTKLFKYPFIEFNGELKIMSIRGRPPTPFSQLHALQLFPRTVSVSGRSGRFHYSSYELNLVFKDASRIALLDTTDLYELRCNAEQLADFIQCPVWDACFEERQ